MKNCIQSSVSQFKRLLGVKPPREGDLEGIPVLTHPMCKELPEELDARNAWPQCSTIGRILDQGHCGSCWAFGAVESLSDCFCIHYGLNNSEDLYSPFMILACPAMVQLGMVEQVNTEAI